jgi:acyl carrier protein phosphodiesterase
MLLNLYADFVKGPVEKIENDSLRKAVLLHRSIDDFIDTDKVVHELKLKLYVELPKVAGIAVDLFFDHLLAKYWPKFHEQPLTVYLDHFFNRAATIISSFENRGEIFFSDFFKQLLYRIEKEEWILNYKKIEGLGFACSGLSRRLSFPNNLYTGPIVFQENEQLVSNTFFDFMEKAKKEFAPSNNL